MAFTLGANLISMNWRHAYFVLGGMFALAAVFVWRYVPAAEIKAVQADRPKISFKEVISDRNVIVLCISMLLLNFLLYGNISWLPSFLADKFTLDIKIVGYLLAVNAVFQALATIFAGVMMTKLFKGKERLFIVSATTLAAILMVLFTMSDSLAISMVLLFAISMISVSAFAALFTLPHQLMDPSIIGSSIGIINSGGTLGGFLSPMILGQLIQAAGGSYTLAFGFMALASLLCGVSVFGIKFKK